MRPLLRYASWQLRDALVDRGLPAFLIGALIFLQAVAAAGAGLGRGWASGPGGVERVRFLLATLIPLFALVGTITVVNGMVSNDRKTGYYRFLFAKPVPIALYYAQTFVLHGVALLAAAALLMTGFAAVAGPHGIGATLLAVAIVYLAAGGLGFLFSVLTSLDWLLLGATWVIAFTLQDNRGLLAGTPFAALAPLVDVLPPAHRLDRVVSTLLLDMRPELGDVAWALAYGTAALLLGLFLLRRRPLAPSRFDP